ncbi:MULTISPECIES: hypothetical protein [unclassified Thermosynechococcus]|uniref:hypothetical protein n=1 Tax=unclassified Thermosynechococcus TaxID=2622553 RepID=UPI0026712D4B|nr:MULTISPECIES: hypothetical protein [unclassified Thermosynechococcus]WKT82991.1 hypothetical protein QYC28_09165 [Thermosynechococcus sp. HY596]WNC62119.1 hypothetical protein RHK13_09160 [Thermosynechococcus sp. HY591]WNC64672.1 hypothetical protein RHK28_09190 [Thermosynechococcus sp. HY593]
MKRKILLSVSSLSAGGAQRIIAELVLALVERGHEITVMTLVTQIKTITGSTRALAGLRSTSSGTRRRSGRVLPATFGALG